MGVRGGGQKEPLCACMCCVKGDGRYQYLEILQKEKVCLEDGDVREILGRVLVAVTALGLIDGAVTNLVPAARA